MQQAQSKASIEATARKLGVELLFPQVNSVDDISAAFQQAQNWKADGYITLSQTLTNIAQEQIAELASKSGRPLALQTPRGAQAGALISLNDNVADIFRIAGIQVAKILKGASPSTLPVEKSSDLELVINLKAATQLNISIPNELLSRATSIIR